jgi:hypothetical protein
MVSLPLRVTIVCSGVMRITVTVVVIMFELTGALAYILPTMVRITRRIFDPLSYKSFSDCTASDQSCRRLSWH